MREIETERLVFVSRTFLDFFSRQFISTQLNSVYCREVDVIYLIMLRWVRAKDRPKKT